MMVYKAFGLIIASEIELPELLPGEGNADVHIRMGKVPREIDDVVDRSPEYQISRTEFLFFKKGIAGFYVKDGSMIMVEPEENADAKALKAYLMGTATGTLLLQRGMVPIHGSTVVVNGKCVILTGACGAGKSTLCSAFRKNGHEFMSDDVSVITVNEEGIPFVQPSFPQQRLCSDTAKEMGYDTENLSLAGMEENKYLVESDHSFRREPIPLAAIVEISAESGRDTEIVRVAGMKKLQCLLNDIYCFAILTRLGIRPAYFSHCNEIAKRISYFNLIRPEGKFTLDEQVHLVKEALSA